MLQSLSQGPETFTWDRVKQIFRENLHTNTEFHCRGTASSIRDGIVYSHSLEERRGRAVEWCKNYYLLAEDPIGHLSRLDASFSELLNCKFMPTESEDDIIDRTCQLLSRLPARPREPGGLVEMPQHPLPSGYFSGDSSRETLRVTSQGTPWEELQVVASLSTNVIGLALQVAFAAREKEWWTGAFHRFVDTIMEVLDAALELSATASGQESEQVWFIVMAFLWTSWQRSTMLLFSAILEGQLTGYDFERNQYLALRKPSVYSSSPAPYREFSQRRGYPEKTKYMCNWAFELLRTDRASVGLDFRRFHELYAELFGNLPARCNGGSQEPCDGTAPEHCQRFLGMIIKDQSAHDSSCSTHCTPLTWDEESYRSVRGARAVQLDCTEDHLLRYCQASDKTLAVSHVWSHGQGGRPETGFNSCLHRRYASIARAFGCDSYWMDTPCIPEDHQLRNESISKINEVFTNSKLTLVCDRDLMEIDTENMTVRLCESLLVTLLVCDWNIRAWTLLEAMRGRQNIYLLCKGNKIVSLKETLETVHRSGSVDIAILLLTAQQLIPSRAPPNSASAYSKRLARGYIGVEEAACLLNHRHASRKGDEVVIWSLLCDDTPHSSAEAFWTARAGKLLNTGFLVSSAPRVQNRRGLGWAPRHPGLSPTSDPTDKSYFAYDGQGTCWGTITALGFEAEWLVHEIPPQNPPSLAARLLPSRRKPTARNIPTIVARFLHGYRWGALLQTMGPATANHIPMRHKDSGGVLLVVVAANDREGWEWRGVYEWDGAEPLPKFEAGKVLLV